MHSASGRSLWPAVVAVVVVLVGIVAFLAGRSGTQPDPTPTASSSVPIETPATTPTPEVSAPVDTGAAPTGCLGGTGRDLAMVQAAQAEAPHTAYGAVEVAASFYRWFMQYPTPPADEVTAAAGSIISATPAQNMSDLAGSYADHGDQLVESVPAGTPFFLSTRDGRWLVDETSTEDRVTVNLIAPYVIDGAMRDEPSSTIALIIVWENNAWRVQQAAQADVDAVQVGGTYFTGGC